MNIRFILSLVIPSVAMFGASYLWHGVLLNDLSKATYSKDVFFIFAPIAYTIISLLLLVLHRLDFLRFVSKNVLTQGFLLGAVSGFFIYIISLVVGISFTHSVTFKNVVVDLPWQMVEQGLGGILISYVDVMIPNSHYE